MVEQERNFQRANPVAAADKGRRLITERDECLLNLLVRRRRHRRVVVQQEPRADRLEGAVRAAPAVVVKVVLHVVVVHVIAVDERGGAAGHARAGKAGVDSAKLAVGGGARGGRAKADGGHAAKGRAVRGHVEAAVEADALVEVRRLAVGRRGKRKDAGDKVARARCAKVEHADGARRRSDAQKMRRAELSGEAVVHK